MLDEVTGIDVAAVDFAELEEADTLDEMPGFSELLPMPALDTLVGDERDEADEGLCVLEELDELADPGCTEEVVLKLDRDADTDEAID